jgi:phage/plasmid-like protein (TIGR03299 family)
MLSAHMITGEKAVGSTTREVLQNAGMDFTVGREPLYTSQGKEIRSKFQRVYRQDNDHTLGVVGRTYQPLQNEELLGVASQLVDNDEIAWDRTGMIDGGSKLWASFTLPDSFRIDGWDDIDQHIYLVNSHDGSGGVKCIPVNVRLGCSNQFAFAMSQIKAAGINPRDLSIRHSSRMLDRVGDFRKAIKLVDTLNQNFADTASDLIQVEMSETERMDYYIDALGLNHSVDRISKENSTGLTTRGNNTLNHLIELEKSSTNNSVNMQDTAWQAFNVVTEYIDHAWIHNASGVVNPKRAESAIVGTGSRLKAKAWDSVVARIIA